jgi:hypothetical protein
MILKFRDPLRLIQNTYMIGDGVYGLSVCLYPRHDCYTNSTTHSIGTQRLILTPVLMISKQQSISLSSLLAVLKDSIVTSQLYLPFACIGDSLPLLGGAGLLILFLKRRRNQLHMYVIRGIYSSNWLNFFLTFSIYEINYRRSLPFRLLDSSNITLPPEFSLLY